jgi:hypothetical protein
VRAVLEDLREHGAEAPFFLEARIGKTTVAQLIAERYLRLLTATPAGSLIVLGPYGRQAVGLSSGYHSPPELAADQYLRRRCLALLYARGWRYCGKVEGHRHLLHVEKGNGAAYLLTRWRYYPAHAVRQVFSRMRDRLVGEGAILLVHTDRPHHLARLIEESKGLIKLFSDEVYQKKLVPRLRPLDRVDEGTSPP